MSVPFFLNQMAFLHVFLRAISFFQSLFQFCAFVAKAAFCKSRAHRGTPKEEKMSLLFFSNRTAFLHVFLRAISFFKSLFQFCLPLQKQHFASLERIGVPQKEEKCHFSFSLIKRHFFMYFYVPFHFFKLFFNFFRCKSSILQV